MGVTVRAYSRLRLLPQHRTEARPYPDECEDGGCIRAYTYACFARSAEGLADADIVWQGNYERLCANRCYQETAETRKVTVLSMSCTSYGEWRDALCRAVNGMPAEEFWAYGFEEAPFRDLIDFADNEGCIGPVAAARLTQDFASVAYRTRFETHLSGGAETWLTERWLTIWDDWLTAVQLAADEGLVRFS